MGSNNKDGFNVADLSTALNAEDRADLVNALKNKLQDLAGKHSDVLENLSPSVRKRVDTLREIQTEHDELEAKFFEERAALEAKYQKLYQPLYTKRYDIVTGVVEVDATQPEDGEDKGVPDFWLTAMKNNEVLAEEISERDEAALKFLKDIKWFRIDNPKGFKLEFYFDTNPFFKNTVLTKTYHMIDEDEPILEKAIGTEIEWLPGKCLTQKVLKKKPKKGSKNAKPITKTEQCESFFNFFSPPQVPDEDDDIDEDAAEELQNLMEQDYDIGSTIRDKIIPHAVSWFTGEAAQDEYGDVDDDEDELDDEDDEDEDEDEEEDEDEDDDEDDEEESKTRKKVKRLYSYHLSLGSIFWHPLTLQCTNLEFFFVHYTAISSPQEDWKSTCWRCGARGKASGVQATVAVIRGYLIVSHFVWQCFERGFESIYRVFTISLLFPPFFCSFR